jgi:hypothetical protein
MGFFRSFKNLGLLACEMNMEIPPKQDKEVQ